MSASDEPLQRRLKDNYVYLINHLLVKDCLDELFEKGVVNEEESDELRELSDLESARRFVDRLKRKGEEVISNFLEIIKRKQTFIYDHLMAKGEGQNGRHGQVAAGGDPRTVGGDQTSESTSGGDSSGLDMKAIVTIKQMKAVAKAVRHKWQDIGIDLDLDINDLEDLSGDKYTRCLSVLKMWKDSNLTTATVEKLVAVGRKAEVYGAVVRALQEQSKDT